MTSEYVSMLRQALERKEDFLELLLMRCKEQTVILKDNKSTPEQLDENIAQKGELIDKINILDEGFETLFKNVESELQKHRENYADEISQMKAYIRHITDLTAEIEAVEHRNKVYATSRFATIRREAKEIKKSGDVVSAYYRGAMGAGPDDPQFFDNKN
ncbi:MAG: flagellar protein FlgN [Pseudobutyrivibrio sp.]|nr:flagellar protein FlgN [Pseudobutyrivibrio sp.]